MCTQPRFCLQQPLSPIHKVLFLASKRIQGKRDPNRKFLHVTLVIARSCQDCRNQPGAALHSQNGIQERTPPTAPYCRCSGLLPRHSRTCAHCSGAHATAEHQDYSMLHLGKCMSNLQVPRVHPKSLKNDPQTDDQTQCIFVIYLLCPRRMECICNVAALNCTHSVCCRSLNVPYFIRYVHVGWSAPASLHPFSAHTASTASLSVPQVEGLAGQLDIRIHTPQQAEQNGSQFLMV